MTQQRLCLTCHAPFEVPATIKKHGHGQIMRCRNCGSNDIEHVEF